MKLLPPRTPVLRPILAALALSLALLNNLPPAFAQADTLIPVRGSRTAATLESISADSQAKFATGESSRTIPLADVVRWGAFTEPQAGVQVLLAGGGLIVAAEAHTENEQLHIESSLLGERVVPLEFVAGIIFRPPYDPQQLDRLANRVRENSARNDQLLLENGDELPGTVISVSDKDVDFETQGKRVTVERSRIAAVGFDPTIVAATPVGGLRVLAGLRDGSRLLISQVAGNSKQMNLTMADGSVWAVPGDSLVALQPLLGKAKYLSDLKAEGYRHLPFLSQTWPYHNDANVAGTQLRAGGHPYVKGIGMHSAARLTYRLDGRYRAFAADVVLDDQVNGGGAAIFAVYVDDKLAWKSKVVRGNMEPIPVQVDTAGAKRLSLLVEFAERGDELDRANWLDARLVD
jgi:hypothetical protein